MKTSTTQILKTLLTLSSVAFLTACGSSNQENSSDLSSRLGNDTTSTAKAVAYCNQAVGTDSTAKLKVYRDAAGTIRMDYMYLRLSALPAAFKTDASYISLWKWMAVPGGTAHLDPSALNFMLVNPSTGLAITGWKTTLRWNDVKTYATNAGISDPQTFFNSITIVVDLKDVNGDYDVLRVSNYDLNTNKALGQTDALMPMFYASPTDYAFEASGETRATSLQGLHPFKGQTGTAAQFATKAQSFCF